MVYRHKPAHFEHGLWLINWEGCWMDPDMFAWAICEYQNRSQLRQPVSEPKLELLNARRRKVAEMFVVVTLVGTTGVSCSTRLLECRHCFLSHPVCSRQRESRPLSVILQIQPIHSFILILKVRLVWLYVYFFQHIPRVFQNVLVY
jgi:hypothetical protein